MWSVLAEAAEATETAVTIFGLPLDMAVGIIAGVSAIAGGMVSGVFALIIARMSNKHAYKTAYDQWYWDKYYDVLSNIDDTHRKMSRIRIRYVKNSIKTKKSDLENNEAYSQLTSQLGSYCSRMALLTDNKAILKQVNKIRESTANVAQLVGNMPKTKWKLSKSEYAEYVKASNQASNDRETLVEMVEGKLAELPPDVSKKSKRSKSLRQALSRQDDP